MSKFIGIDISKQTFDVCFLENNKWHHKVMENNKKGFKQILKLITDEDWVVMEASGSYYVPLAEFLSSNNTQVCVVNPLVIKRFSQANLYRAKTDKKDAQTIAEYAQKYELKAWQPESDNTKKLRQLYTRIEMLNKQVHQNRCQLEAFTSSGSINKSLLREIKGAICYFNRHIQKLKKDMEQIAKEEFGETIQRIESIPGVGKQTAMMLSVITDNFRKFDHYKQLIAYIGFSPRVYQSGSSVRGRGHICKMGKSQIRKLLYLCSWSAKRCNKSCQAMYARLKEAGKPERVIKVAIANKLIKQIFAIATKKQNYSEQYLTNGVG